MDIEFKLALGFLENGFYEEAKKACDNLLAKISDDFNVLLLSGLIEIELENYETALERLNYANEINPKNAEILDNLGVIYQKINQPEKAVEFFEKSIAIDTNRAATFANLSAAYLDMDNIEKALYASEKAINIDVNNPDNHLNHAFSLLSAGDYEKGFAEYEYRLQTAPFINQYNTYDICTWDGADNIQGKTLLIRGEQGAGDQILFSRFLPVIKELYNCNIVFECYSFLHTLMLRSFPFLHKIIDMNPKNAPLADIQIPLMSLPKILKVSKKNIPNTPYIPYQSPPLDKDINIGISWASKKTPKDRSFPLEMLAKTINNIQPKAKYNIHLYGLQKSDAADKELDILRSKINDKNIQITNAVRDSSDFAETANVMQNLHLVITADSVIANLAGAMGIQGYIMLLYGADWKWQPLAGENISPWYPTIKLCKQSALNDWNSAFERLETYLSKNDGVILV